MFDKNGTDAAAYIALLFLFLYNAGFNIACNPLAYSHPTEILPYSMRTKGLAVMVAIGWALLIASQYANPVAIAAIGWEVLALLYGNAGAVPFYGVLHVPRNEGPYPWRTCELVWRRWGCKYDREDEAVNMIEKMKGIEPEVEVLPVGAEKKEWIDI
jgi:Sugar (and other) transporter